MIAPNRNNTVVSSPISAEFFGIDILVVTSCLFSVFGGPHLKLIEVLDKALDRSSPEKVKHVCVMEA